MKILKLGQSLGNSNGGSTPETDFIFTVDTTIAGSTGVGNMNLPIGSGNNINIDWGDGSVDTGVTFSVTHFYASAAVYTIKVSGTLTKWSFANGDDKLKMLDIVNWGIFNFDLNAAFYGCSNMTCSATDKVTITGTLLQNSFRNCTLFNGNISNWNVSSATRMDFFFFNCAAFNQDIGSWDVSNVTTLNKMFQGATLFNQNIGAWDVSSCTVFTSFMVSATAASFSTANLDAIYNGWSLLTLSANETITFGSAKYSAAGVAGRAVLTSAPNNWTITDGGL
tara:strand:+ start:1372 stop:2211 length:840 start_codon:yes stop_codon:yes gene_type:complete